jgi:hypothetical protein
MTILYDTENFKARQKAGMMWRIGAIRCECELVLCQRREPTFNQPSIEVFLCEVEGGSEPSLLDFCGAAKVRFRETEQIALGVSGHCDH